MRPTPAALVLLLAAFARCLEPDATDQTPEPGTTAGGAVQRVQSLLKDVPCDTPYSGTKTTGNLLRIKLTEFDGPSGPQEIDIRGNLLLAARAGGFSTVDISDPANPIILGHYGDAGGMLDVKFSPDNQTALVASARGIDLVDIRNPDDPVQVGQWLVNEPANPSGASEAHMIYTAHIKGQDWVFVATQSGTGAWILRMDGTPDARKLTFVSRTDPSASASPHDIFVQFDNDLQRWILYTTELLGWGAFDVTDPANPTFIVVVPNNEPSGTHSVQAAKVGERRLVATSTEFGTNVMKVFDATDLRAPILIAYWTRQAGPEVYEHQHNLNIVQGRLYMAHYALGLFVFDLTKIPTTPAGVLDLKPVAHYASSQKSNPGSPAQGGFWDLVVHDGLLYAGAYTGDFEVGLHTIGYGCIPAGDANYTSTG
ncbi:MAG TPA: hypothetical protein VGB18_05795 [Candidatus Thermoplasmatota archaeon]